MTKALGDKGEKIAARYLKKKGYRVLKCSYKAQGAEVDIIAKYKGEIIFVEVKTRSSNKFGYPEEAVTTRKRNQIHKAAQTYLENKINETPWRIDIIAIIIDSNEPKIEHFEAI